MPRKPGGPAGQPSQREMVKVALEELGADAKPGQLQEHIQQKFNKELAKQVISSYKSQLKSKPSGAKRAVRSSPATDGTVELRDIVAVQDLLRRYGQTHLASLIKMLDK